MEVALGLLGQCKSGTAVAVVSKDTIRVRVVAIQVIRESSECG